ncbi:hypothetical protein E4T44_14980 [Aureobasidium sp. EXF-8845]|nr:hypothetical protein E4T44_14980 [Aureobasidium sp. EXF-8845]KAI4749878.1 hypothetical protein E4T45_14809 [Aureobasidium sp. EXF-8846]
MSLLQIFKPRRLIHVHGYGCGDQTQGCRMDRACSCREGPANPTAERRVVLARTAFLARQQDTLVLFSPPAGTTNGATEWSCRTCMRSSRELSQLASFITHLLGRPETFSLHDVVDFPLSAWHLGSKGTH